LAFHHDRYRIDLWIGVRRSLPCGLHSARSRDAGSAGSRCAVLAAQSACPKNAAEWVDALKRAGARMEPTMVNFVGFHNPDAGAFFIFEIVSSDSAAPSNLAILRGDATDLCLKRADLRSS